MHTDPLTTHRRIFLAACAALAGELLCAAIAGEPGLASVVGGVVAVTAAELWRLRERRRNG